MGITENISIFIPTCPIPSHPDTGILERTIDSVRACAPDATLLIGFDGIRGQVRDIPGRVENYEQFKKNCYEKVYSGRWGNVVPNEFIVHRHQTGMLFWALRHVTTKFLLFQEHDCPWMRGRVIHWEQILHVLDSEMAKTVRFPWHPRGVHPDHDHTVMGEFTYDSVRFVRVRQWSGWPHITTTDFCRKVMRDHFDEREATFLEPRLEAYCQVNPDYFRIVMYCPEEAQILDSHENARLDKATGKYDPNGL